MCGEDHDFRLCRAQDGSHRGLAVFRVEAGERLVERERVGWRKQRSSECQPALHAAGIIAYLLCPHVAKSQFFQQRLRRRGGEVWLMPENPAYPPINGTGCQILGVVKAVYREY